MMKGKAKKVFLDPLGANNHVFAQILGICSTLAVTAVVSVSGIVQWIGLIIPHFARILFGVDSRYSLPGSLLLGGIMGLLCDTLARVVLPGEIPLGIVTSLLGAVLFVILLSRKGTNYR